MPKNVKNETPSSKAATKVTPEADNTEVPSIKSIKEKILKRINNLVNDAQDPARLAQAYKILSEYEGTDDKKGKKSVIDAVMDNVKPMTKEDEATPVTMLDVLRADGKAPITGTRPGPGRPRKPKVSPYVKVVEEPEIIDNEE